MLGVGQSPPVERHRGARPWMRIDAGRQVDPVAVAKFTLRGLKAPAVPGPAIAHASAHSSAAARSRLSAISIPAPCPSPEMPPIRSRRDRKSVVEGKSVSVRVKLGGRRIIKTKNKNRQLQTQ